MNKQAFLQENQLSTLKVEVAGLGTIVVREISASDAVKFAEKKTSGYDRLAELIQYCVFDEDGKQIFTVEDIPAILNLKQEALAELSVPVAKINGFIDEIQADTHEEIKKKSPQSTSESSQP